MGPELRWRLFLEGRPRPRDLVEFHTVNKYELLARDPEAYAALGRIVAGADELPLEEYGRRYLDAMAREPTRATHCNVLEHLAGMLRESVPASDATALRRAIERFRAGEAPLSEPLAFIRAHARAEGLAWVSAQTYLQRFAG